MDIKNVVISSDFENWYELEGAVVAQVEVPEGVDNSTSAHELTVLKSFKLKDNQLGWSDEAGGES